MKNEYEIISHNNSNFHLFLVSLFYRTPHIHKDFEIGLVLEGSLSLINPNCTLSLSAGDIYIMNPYYSHELKAEAPALILSLQVSPAFFASYYLQIEKIAFDTLLLSAPDETELCSSVRSFLFEIAFTFYKKTEYGEIKCASLINQLFFSLLCTKKHHLISEKEKQFFQSKGTRIWNITHYIEKHYTEKILLSDIAREEDIDLYYLSHFFKECFGISFQNYVMRLRCERARQLLLLTDYSLLDICISCGFSDPKYFNKGFKTQYGCSPKEYRHNFQNSKLEQQQKSMLTTQEFLSESAALITLQRLYGTL